MSNQVGQLYQSVIDGVVREARVDFEDMGESESMLLDLQREWQSRLSSMRVADRMPWDPEDKSFTSHAGGLGNGFYGYDISIPLLSGPTGPMPPTPSSLAGVVGSGAAGAGASYAKDEAGYSLPASLSGAAHANSHGAGASANTGGLEVPGDVNSGLEHSGLVLPQLPQTDGVATDVKDLRGNTERDAPLEIREADLRAVLQEVMNTHSETPTARPTKVERIPQVDGANDETVGSDLDDSEDELNSDNDDEDADQGMIMLCLYDKVQRVKNKWKYVLKDGVANINGRDYVFAKATGESEW